MTSTSYTNIPMQDNLDGTLSTPLGTEHIPPVRPAPINAPTQPGTNVETLNQDAANQSEKIIPTWVYFSVVSAVLMSAVYWFKNFA